MLLILQGTEQHVITKRKIIQNVSSTENRNITVSCVFASEFLSLWMSKSKHTLPSHFKHLNFPMPKCSQKMCSFLSFSTVQFSSVAQSCPTFCHLMDCSKPGYLSITNSQSLLKLMSIELVRPSNHLILCCPILFLPSIFRSIRVFSNESVLHVRFPKYWSFSCKVTPSNTNPSWPSYFQFPTIVRNPLSFLFLLI